MNVGVVLDEIRSAFIVLDLDYGIKNKRFLTVVSLVHAGVTEEKFTLAF